jgi:signal transduction histidine kinase
VDFKHSGDFNSLPANVLETISSDIKEALTNAYKYSRATIINIIIDINEGIVRVYIKDNGEGCPSLKEGFGLLGIRERIKNLGGTVSFSGEKGFVIVYVIPFGRDRGELFENNNSG